MINLLQRSLRPLLVIVLCIIAVPFIFITTGPVFERNGPEINLGKIDGQKISPEQFREAETSVYVLLTLRYGNQIPETPQVRRQIQMETWQRLLLLSQAKKAGVQMSDQQVAQFIRNMPSLQKDGVYQPERLDGLVKYFQQSMNISENRFMEILREELIVEKMQKLIASPIQVPASEVTAQFDRIYSPVTLSTINFPIKNFLSQVSVTAPEVDSEYNMQMESNPALRTKERRRISYVFFPAPAPASSTAKNADATKDDARRKIGEKAFEFALALEPEPTANAQRPNFAATAQKYNLTVGATGLFAADEAPAPLPPSPNLNRAAFNLSNDRPTSSVVETDSGFYVLKIEEIAASQPRPLPEVRSTIEEQIKNRKALTLLQEAGNAAAEKLRAEVAKGVPFRTAAAQLKLTVEALPAFVPGDPKLNNDTKLALARRLAMQLKIGEVSPFVPTAGGGVIAFLDSRQAPDRKTYGDAEAQLRAEMLNQARYAALEEWVRWRSTSSGTAMPTQLMQKPE